MLFAVPAGMDTSALFGVTSGQALQFFFERLRDITDDGRDHPPTPELLYNASLLAHFAGTSTDSATGFPRTPTGLRTVFDVYVLDRSQHLDAEILEGAGSQCLFLTGFFQDQQKHRHQVHWYASLGAGFYDDAAHYGKDRERSRMMETMAKRFEFWRQRYYRLSRELAETPKLIVGGPSAPGGAPPVIM